MGYGPVAALGFTVSPTLLTSAFYRECHSYKVPQIHCAMAHTALLCVVHGKIIEHFHLEESCCPNGQGD